MIEKTLKEWALHYSELGFSVFPLRPRDKKPATANGFKDATRSREQIESWWGGNTNYNIGIATGTASGGLVVIDLDVDENKGINGYEVLRKWESVNCEFANYKLLHFTLFSKLIYLLNKKKVMITRKNICKVS